MITKLVWVMLTISATTGEVTYSPMLSNVEDCRKLQSTYETLNSRIERSAGGLTNACVQLSVVTNQ